MNKLDIDKEIDFVVKVITHPAGYDLDLFGYFCVRPTDQGVWCVSYDHPGKYCWEKCFPTALEAATYFVNTRIKDKIGVDFEYGKEE